VFTTGGRAQKRGNCLFRASRVQDDTTWEYWTGTQFHPSRSDPYQAAEGERPACQPLQNLDGRVWTVRRHRPTGLYLATVGVHRINMPTGIIGISVSTDLHHWSTPVPVFKGAMVWSRNCGDTVRYGYPSLIDFGSPDRNFSDVGDTAELYMMQMHIARCGGTLHRNLIRYKLQISARGK
jgi:hypothetical protein